MAWILVSFGASRLHAFGPTATIYFDALKNGLIIATAFLTASLVFFISLDKRLESMGLRLRDAYASLGSRGQNMCMLAVCAVFSFASHANNILRGYFYLDDFEVMEVARANSFLRSLLIPHGEDHILPLFRIEMKILDTFFGTNPTPYNIFVFIIFALTSFFTYLAFKRLKLPVGSFIIFLVLFSGTPAWSEILTGYYTISIYLQISFFFAVMLWAYAAWMHVNRRRYLAIFAIALAGAVTVDNTGVWVVPAIIIAMAATYRRFDRAPTAPQRRLRHFFLQNRYPLSIVVIVGTLYAAFFAISFLVLQPGTFLSSSHTNIPHMAKDGISVISSGLTLAAFAPHTPKLLAHPVLITSIGRLWPSFEYALFFLNLLFFWCARRNAARHERTFLMGCAGILLLTIFMVVRARPGAGLIPDFNFKHVGMLFYFYCAVLAIGINSIVTSKRLSWVKTALPFLIVTVAAQQAFSFHAIRLREEAISRRTATELVQTRLISELKKLSQTDGTALRVPNLSGSYIYEPQAGISLTDYVQFFNAPIPIAFLQNGAMPPHVKTHTVTTVPSLRAATSREFKDALKTSARLQQYYTAPTLVGYQAELISRDSAPAPHSPQDRIMARRGGDAAHASILIDSRASFDPEKFHRLSLELVTDDIPGNIELPLAFTNDFVKKSAARVRIDDFTPYVLAENKRRYALTADLLQIYIYALSERVGNLMLEFPPRKNIKLTSMSFE
ncbi:MAG: hypothetical protein HY007_02935 [Candidatus Sungbacteria bacterium]|nr:hypothetical protein [Candidatus Sungbacteria bacterium]